MSANLGSIGVSGRLDLGEKLWGEQPCHRWNRFECPHASKYLTAVVPGDPDGSDFPGPLVHVEIRGVTDVDASFAEVHRTLRVAGKMREKVASDWDHRVGLVAYTRHPARQEHVLRISEHA